MERVPYRATAAAAAYDGLRPLPVAMLLDDVRSMYNVGACFRTADAAGLERLLLCGITPHPERIGRARDGIAKTALGAESSVTWEHHADACDAARLLLARGYSLAAIETSLHAVDLFDWQPRFPVCVVMGHEVEGVRRELLDLCDTHVRIPMLGVKHSLNVATAAGIVAFELLRKRRQTATVAQL